jgi:hypothetical protein
MLAQPKEPRMLRFRAAIALIAVLVLPSWSTARAGPVDRAKGLRSQIEDTDKIRVRSGGTCHRTVSEERTLFEVVDGAAITRVIASIVIDDEGSGFNCMCCGEPTLEFYSGTTLLASVGFHHGISLRWTDGWEGDSALDRESAEKLCVWLAEHGVDEPLNEWREHTQRDEAWERRAELYQRVIPAKTLEALESATSEDEAVDAFKRHVKGHECAKLCFEFLGGALYGWDAMDPVESIMLDRLLPETSPDDVIRAIEMAIDDDAGARGVARWVLWRSKWETIDPNRLAPFLPALGRAGLSHPDEETRRIVLWALWRMGTPPATQLIRAFAWSSISPVEAEEIETVAPTGKRMLMPRPGMVESARETTAAIVYLSRLDDAQSLAIAQRLMENAPLEDRELLTEAVRRLREGPTVAPEPAPASSPPPGG